MAEILNKSYLKPEEKYPRIKLSLFPVLNSGFKKYADTKGEAVYLWLKNWIEKHVENGTIKRGCALPLKDDLAYYFGVGSGTIQYAVRKLEDDGVVASKQRIGTLIKDVNNEDKRFRKLTSKREKVIYELKFINE